MLTDERIEKARLLSEQYRRSDRIEMALAIDDLLAERRELLAEIDRLTYDRDLQESVAIWGTGDRAT